MQVESLSAGHTLEAGLPLDKSQMTRRSASQWSPSSWRSYPARQQAPYPDDVATQKKLARVYRTLEKLPALITHESVDSLRTHLAQCANGNAFCLTGGDCAEAFATCSAECVGSKVRVLEQMRTILSQQLGGLPVVVIGRMAGQYAKPRSSDFEKLPNGRVVASFRGENVNGIHENERRPDPERLIRGYYHSAATLQFAATAARGLRQLSSTFDLATLAGCAEQHQCSTESVVVGGRSHIYCAHEALELALEEIFTRTAPSARQQDKSKTYNLSSHFVWMGNRTRQVDGAHVEYFRGIANPIGVKVGPTLAASPSELVELIEKIWPDSQNSLPPGKVSIILRMGAANAKALLPNFFDTIIQAGIAHKLVWVTDPCHGNTAVSTEGLKYRPFEGMLDEAVAVFETLHAHGLHPGGMHLELCGEPVTECTGGPCKISQSDIGKRFGSLCDPRLSYQQSLRFAFEISATLKALLSTAAGEPAPRSSWSAGESHSPAAAAAEPTGRTRTVELSHESDSSSAVFDAAVTALLAEEGLLNPATVQELRRLTSAVHGATRGESVGEQSQSDRVSAGNRRVSLPALGGKRASKAVFGTLFLSRTKEAFSLLDRAWALGVNTFDCAAIYGGGECERILGQWLLSRGISRDDVVLCSKGACDGQEKQWAANLAPERIASDLRSSLHRLGVDNLDVFMLHRDDESVPVAQIVKTMDELHKEGLFTAWGVSNWSFPRLKAACAWARDHNCVAPSFDSVQFSLAEPGHAVWPKTTFLVPTPEISDWYEQNGVSVLAWECLGKGFCSGKWTPIDAAAVAQRSADVEAGLLPPLLPSGATSDQWREARLVSAYCTNENFARRQRARDLGCQLGLEPSQVALRYVFAKVLVCVHPL